jgi:radical SAM protein with 4Fe4S-binding SPASM domain
VKLREARRRLPVVGQLPPGRTRAYSPTLEKNTPRPALAVWELTLACDHRCLHCGPRAGQARPDELSTEEALALVEELAEVGVGEVTLIGGEAYLRNDFILIIRRIRELGMTCSMTTGGLTLTRARAEAMVEAGIQSVSVSIDGLEKTHDFVRNRDGSWERAFAALRTLRRAGAKVACNTQINRSSRLELLPLLELLAAESIWAWQLQVTCPHGNAVDHPDIVLQPYMYLDLFETISQVVDRCRELGIVIWPGNNLGYFGPHEFKLRKQQKAASGHFTGCEAGRFSIAIESNGNIKNCPSLGGPENTGGNWRQHGLAELWNSAPQIGYFRQRTVDDLWGYCRECYYATTCMAGCTAASEPILGRPGNNPFCHHRALEMDKLGLRERIELVAGAASDRPFASGLFRVIREHKDETRRRAHGGPVAIEGPRTSRMVDWDGAGRELTPEEVVRGGSQGSEV